MVKDTYFEIIKKIKKRGNIPFIHINYNDSDVILKLIDDSDETVKFVTELRKRFCHMFATYFKISDTRTKKWIRESLENKDWIQFIVYVNEKRMGTIGNVRYDKKTNSAELDNLTKYPNHEFPGLFNVVEKVYLKWMFENLQLNKITEKLFTDNYQALNSHIKCGFKIIDVIPIKRKFLDDGWIWENMILNSNNEFGERYYHIIELTKENLMKNFGNIKFKILE